MKIKAGDKVKFLNDTGSGEIVSIIDKKTALVKIEDDFEVPVLISDLVVESGVYYENEEDENEIIRTSPQETQFSGEVDSGEGIQTTEDEEVLLSFVPREESSDFSSYLINSSSYQLKYVISRSGDGDHVLYKEGELEPGLKVSLGKFHPGNLNDVINFRVQAIFYNSGFYIHLPPLDSLIRIDPAQMYNASTYQENDYFEERAIIYTLHDWRKRRETLPVIDPEEIRKAMFTKGDVKPEKVEERSSEVEEVDLHIGNLTDDYKELSNGEIMEIQMSRFRTALDSAILHKTKRIVFIHGVGNGKLKHEIRKALEKDYKKVRFQDASFKEYGYGATMVLI